MSDKFKHTIGILVVIAIVLLVAIEAKPRFAPYFINQGTKAFDKGRINDALMYSKIAAQLDPLEPQVHYILGEIYARRQIYGVAIKEHKKTIELNPLYSKSHHALGEIYFKMRQYKNALAELQMSVQIDPENSDTKELIESIKHIYSLQLIDNAIDAYQKGARDEARELLKTAFRIRYSHMYSLFAIINIYTEKAKPEKLINSWSKITRLDPKYKLGYRLLGDIYLENTEYKRAKDAYKKFLDIEPNNASIHHNLALAYNRLKMYDEAIDEFRIALSLIPDNPDIIYGLASTYKDKQMYEEAMNLYKHLLKSGYELVYVYLDMAQVYKETRKTKEAKETTEETIKLCEEKLAQDSGELIYRITLDKARMQLEEYKQIEDIETKSENS